MNTRSVIRSLRRTLYGSSAIALVTAFAFLAFGTTPARAGTTLTVSSTADIRANDGKCTLREAIIAANTDSSSGAAAGECPAGSGADTIIIPAGTYTLTLLGALEDLAAAGDLDIRQDVTIQGAGTACASPPNPACTIINANSIDRVFDITTTVLASLSKMQIQGGTDFGWGGAGINNNGILSMTQVLIIANNASALGGGLYNTAGARAQLDSVSFGNNQAGHGAAIYNAGGLTLTRVALTFDTASFSGGGLENYGDAFLADVNFSYETAGSNGGGIYNGGNLTLTRTTLNRNQATTGKGGGIYNGHEAWITNTTVSTNTASSAQGGGIYSLSYYDSWLLNATLYENGASSGGNFYRDTTGGKNGLLSLKNTLVANSTSGGNCAGGAITSLGYNLDSANTCVFSATGDLTTTAPLLGPLANNGGKTWTHALLAGSPAINRIPLGANGCGTTLTTDQRGYPRFTPCDVGAYEYVVRAFFPLILK